MQRCAFWSIKCIYVDLKCRYYKDNLKLLVTFIIIIFLLWMQSSHSAKTATSSLALPTSTTSGLLLYRTMSEFIPFLKIWTNQCHFSCMCKEGKANENPTGNKIQITLLNASRNEFCVQMIQTFKTCLSDCQKLNKRLKIQSSN